MSRRRMYSGAGLLFGGQGAAQLFSLLRNVLIARMIGQEQFGIASTLVVTIALLTMLGDMSLDKFIVQTKEFDEKRLVGSAHLLLLGRGVVIGLVLLALARPLAGFFEITQYTWAFMALAVLPVIQGMNNLRYKVLQRDLVYMPTLIVESVPILISTALAWPLAMALHNFTVVLWVAIAQIVMQMVLSHIVAKGRYPLSADRESVMKFLRFGWPLMLNAVVMYLALHGDRFVVGRWLGLDTLAIYAVAATLALLPSMLCARVLTTLMLPWLGAAQDDDEMYTRRSVAVSAASVGVVLVLMVPLSYLGPVVVSVVYGPQYEAAGWILVVLAGAQGVRLLRAVPTLIAMGRADTLTSLIANVSRAAMVVLIGLAAVSGLGVLGVALVVASAEVVTLVIAMSRLRRLRVPVVPILPAMVTGIVGLAAAGALSAATDPMTSSLAISVVWAMVLLVAVLAMAMVLVPAARTELFRLVSRG